ncbi:universal stress protein [Kribbella amoyensis]|uniref:universal stress protein n=1 Tax=Kribbella amoyensis TaxID=996641 RepID=UPI0011A65677|nr:universal stress protein [Kribbella amoyensis]
MVVEVDSGVEGLPAVDYACIEALRTDTELLMIAPYQVHGSYSPTVAAYRPKTPAELADDALRRAVSHVRHHYGEGMSLVAISGEGARPRVLARTARRARMVIVGQQRATGSQRSRAARANLALAGRTGRPVVVVPDDWQPSAEDRKIAVGIDGAPLSSAALEFALRTASERQATLVVVYAGLPDHRDDNAELHPWLSRAEFVCSEALAAATGKYPGVEVTTLLSNRPAAEALVHESRQVGLVVVGCHAGHQQSDPVARRCLAVMTCPVAIVPERGTFTDDEPQARVPVEQGRTAARIGVDRL